MFFATRFRRARNGLREASRARSRRVVRPVFDVLEDRTLLSDTQAPVVINERPVSTNELNPDIVRQSAIEVRARASDSQTGNSGILENSFRFEYRQKPQGGTWTNWLSYAGFSTVIDVGLADTTVTTLFRGVPNYVYGFRVTASDGAGNSTTSTPTYATILLDDDIDIDIVIDPQCSTVLSAYILNVASSIIDELNYGDKVGVIVANDQGNITFPMTQITPGSNVQEQAKAALRGTFSGFAARKMNELILAAQGELQRFPADKRRAVVALTDGIHSKLAPALESLGSQYDTSIGIYAVGYGRDGNQRPSQELAHFGNGHYYYNPGPAEVARMYSQMSGGGEAPTLARISGTVRQGEVASKSFFVTPSALRADIHLKWNGGDLNLELVAPDGTVVTFATPNVDTNVRFFGAPNFERFRIEAPQWGDWQIRVVGAGVAPAASTNFEIIANAPLLTGNILYTVSDEFETILNGDTLNMGAFVVGSPAPTLSLSVRNDGAGPISVQGIRVPAGFTVQQAPSGLIPQGASALIVLRMETSTIGHFGGTASVFVGDPFTQPLLFSFVLLGDVTDGSPDTTPPLATARPDLNPASDLGNSDSDDLTSRSTLFLNGTGEANTTLRFFDGNSVLGEAVARRTGRWSFTTPALADGEHVFSARSIDAAGNVGPLSIAMSVVVDTAPPQAPVAPDLEAVSDSGSSDTDNLTNRDEPELMGMTEPNAMISVFDGGPNPIVITYADSVGMWHMDNWELAEGQHSLTVRVKDEACNASPISQPLVVNIDRTAPAVPPKPDLTANRDHGTSNSDDVTNAAALILNGTSEANSVVNFFDGISLLGSSTASPDGAWSFASPDLAAGTHSISVQATDAAGNTSTTSLSLNVLVDLTAPPQPTLDLDAASDLGDSNTDNLTSDDTPTIRGVAERDGRIELFDGLLALGTADVNSVGAWSLTSSSLAHGLHTLTVRAMDVAGNLSTLSTGLTVNIDTQLPNTPAGADLDDASDSGRSTTDNITRDATPTIRGTTTPNINVFLFEGAAQIGTGRANASGAWTVTSRGLSDGTHPLTVRTRDAAGNLSLASATINVQVDTAAPLGPSALSLDSTSDSGISNSDLITNDITPDILGVGEPNAIVELFEAGFLVGPTTADAAGTWVFRSAAANRVFDAGVHLLVARATDTAGNVGSTSTDFSFTIDTTPPATPPNPDLIPASDSGSSNSDNITNDTTPSLGGTAEANLPIELFDGTNSIGTTNTDGNGAWSFATALLTEGPHRITAQVRDVAGNTSTTPIGLNLTIDTTVPVAPSAPDLDAGSDTGNSTTDDLTNDATPRLTGTSEPASTIRVFSGATLLGTTVATNTGTWNFTGNLPLPDGVHRLTARSVDPAGNNGGLSAELPVTIDATAPTVDRFELVPGARNRIGQIIIRFAELLNPVEAGNLANYGLVQQGRRPKPIGLTAANVVGQSVTLTPAAPFSAKKLAGMILTAGAGGTLTDQAGNVLDGNRDGLAGDVFVSPLNLATPLVAGQRAILSSLDILLERDQLSGQSGIENLLELLLN